MDGTPKLQRKASLSLSTRINHKRHSASPQNHLKTSTSTGAINARDLNGKCVTPQRSPSVISICSDGGIECTPPHKKIAMNLDDSLDYSPKVFDSSFSPTCLLSQTLAIDSPEVGWKWSRHGANNEVNGLRYGFEDNSTRTPDSAYAADSSFASAGSSSTEVVTNRHRIAYEGRRDDQRKMLEQELRRVEKTRAEEKLKQRCAKLQEQLKSAGTQNSKTKSQNNNKQTKPTFTSISSLNDVEMKSQTNASIKNSTSTFKSESLNNIKMQTAPTIPIVTSTTSVKFHTPEKSNKPELLNDFFNDSDLDCFLLEATQEIESKMEAKTQPVFVNFATTTPKSSTSSECNSIPHANSAPPATTTPPSAAKKTSATGKSRQNSENKEKRSSFYMKFMEDDCPDDWFVSLDEVILQATQTKKPRTSLLRYKSMPAETATNSSVTLNKKDKNDNCIISTSTNYSKRLEDAGASSSSLSKMKRHSSTHNLSPAAGTSLRSRRQL